MSKKMGRTVKNRDYGFGKCRVAGCSWPAVVGLNGSYVCMIHFDAGMKRVGETVRKAREAVSA